MSTPAAGKVIRTLVIEDNPTNLELMSYILKAFGHTIFTAQDGRAGLDLAMTCEPTIIICDVQIPRMDGYEVARRVKALPPLKHIPLIAVTALAMVGDRERLLAAGFDGYIPKPIAPETFVKQVEEFLPSSERLGLVLHNLYPEADETPVEHEARGSILILNHSEPNTDLARSIFEKSGFKVLTRKGYPDAAAEGDHFVPDLVVYDVHGHVDRGTAVLQKLAEDEKLRSTPLIMISSSPWQAQDRTGGEGLGPVRYLVRPLDPALLLGAVNACLAKASSAGPG